MKCRLKRLRTEDVYGIQTYTPILGWTDHKVIDEDALRLGICIRELWTGSLEGALIKMLRMEGVWVEKQD